MNCACVSQEIRVGNWGIDTGEAESRLLLVVPTSNFIGTCSAYKLVVPTSRSVEQIHPLWICSGTVPLGKYHSHCPMDGFCKHLTLWFGNLTIAGWMLGIIDSSHLPWSGIPLFNRSYFSHKVWFFAAEDVALLQNTSICAETLQLELSRDLIQLLHLIWMPLVSLNSLSHTTRLQGVLNNSLDLFAKPSLCLSN